MEETLPNSSERTANIGKMLVGALILLVVFFLVIGTVNQQTAPENEFAFGIQTLAFPLIALLAFAGGLLSFASPCTLPILPAYFAFAFQSGRRQIAVNTLMFLIGLATMFSLLGATASAVGRVLRQNTSVILLIGGAAVLVFGVVSLMGRGFSGMKSETNQQTTLGGSFVFGVTFAVGWSSCVGPILGAVLTLAATTGSVIQGILLLFIYALGLGLPLLIVSTLFGRASRQSLFWRALRGKGWNVTVHKLVVGAVWALAVWQILAAVIKFAFFDPFTGPEFTPLQNYGLLALVLAGAAVWAFTSGERRMTLQLHSTQLVSGGLFILMGMLMLSGQLALFNNLVPEDLALWFIDIEDQLINLFS